SHPRAALRASCNSRSSTTGKSFNRSGPGVSMHSGHLRFQLATVRRVFMRNRAQFLATAIFTFLPAILSCRVAHAQGELEAPPPIENPIIQAAKMNMHDLCRVKVAGEFCFRHGDWSKSVYWLSQAYSLSHANREIGYELISAQIQSGDLKGAERQLQEVSASGDTVKLHALCALLRDRSGNYSDAAHEYYRAAELEPTEDNLF